MDFGFALRDETLRNTTRTWLTSHLLAHLFKPSAVFSEHLCRQRRNLGFAVDAPRCRLPPKVLGVQLHLYSGTSSMKHYVSTAMRLLVYTGAPAV